MKRFRIRPRLRHEHSHMGTWKMEITVDGEDVGADTYYITIEDAWNCPEFQMLYTHLKAKASDKRPAILSKEYKAAQKIAKHECLNDAIDEESVRGRTRFGRFNSAHELYGVLREELEEFWDSVKCDDPDPWELLQICAVAKRGIEEMTTGILDESDASLHTVEGFILD